ncbi:MAG: hypothetical protein JWQ62_157 [Lacunisphaera sp.]|nr:hypothetical protein [Lacunisphaera sp.]
MPIRSLTHMLSTWFLFLNGNDFFIPLRLGSGTTRYIS